MRALSYSSKGQQHLPGEEAWLVGEHRTSGERKYYLFNLPAGADLAALAATMRGPPQPTLPAIRRAITAALVQRPPDCCPHCRIRFRRRRERKTAEVVLAEAGNEAVNACLIVQPFLYDLPRSGQVTLQLTKCQPRQDPQAFVP